MLVYIISFSYLLVLLPNKGVSETSPAPLQCGPNEVLNICPGYCVFDNDCLQYVYGVIRDCTTPPPIHICVPRCDCVAGMVRINGECVSPDNCCEEPNTHVVDCPVPCEESCYFTQLSECIEDCYMRKCQCLPGYVRENNTCILKSECNYSCPGPNEVYSPCKNPCPDTCQSIRVTQWPPIACAPLNPCPGGCDCVDGYVRDDNNVCVRRETCLSCDDPNAEFVECPNPCPLTCNNLLTHGSTPCILSCLNLGCQCKTGYVKRNDSVNADCILVSECTAPQCGPNEVFNPCPDYHTDDDCLAYMDGIIGSSTPPSSGNVCVSRCECVAGMVRINGQCVSPDNCCKQPHTHLVDCPAQCEESCYELNLIDCIVKCSGRICQCLPGYFRQNDTCVRASECVYNCPPNERYSRCKYPCPDTCQSIVVTTYPQYVCSAPYPCPPGCECIPGYVRNSNKVCVPRLNCFKCNDSNAEAVLNPDPCPLTCDNLLTHGSTPCNRWTPPEGCQCKPGYVRRSDTNYALCIKSSDCPPLSCGPNEVWNSCPSYCTFDDDCDKYMFGYIRDCPKPPPDYTCIPRCQCKPGTVRINGRCRSPNKCCEEPNTHPVNCSAPCEKTCHITPLPKCTEVCSLRKCQCLPGYVRHNNTCIHESKCNYLCHGPNEKYSQCKNPCPDTCESIKKPRKACLPPTPCPGGCDCKNGYVRDMNQVCIKKEKCPIDCKDPKKEYLTCGSACPPTCDNRNPSCSKICKKGCFCKKGYVLNCEDQCVRPKACF